MKNCSKVIVILTLIFLGAGCSKPKSQYPVRPPSVSQQEKDVKELYSFAKPEGNRSYFRSGIRSIRQYKERRNRIPDSIIPLKYLEKIKTFDNAIRLYEKWIIDYNEKHKEIIRLGEEYIKSQEEKFKNVSISDKTNIYDVSIKNIYYDFRISDYDSYLKGMGNLAVGKIVKKEKLRFPEIAINGFKIKILVENISVNNIGYPAPDHSVSYYTTTDTGVVVQDFYVVEDYKFLDNHGNKYSPHTKHHKTLFRPGEKDIWEFSFALNQTPIENISELRVEFTGQVFGKPICLRIPKRMLSKIEVEKINKKSF